MKKAVFLKMILICVISFNACTKVEGNRDTMPHLFSSETAEYVNYAKAEESDSKSTESEEVSSEQKQWKVNICSDMPEPYIDVLMQYEQFMNADNQDLNDESVRSKFRGGEWKDLYDELCASWSTFTENSYHYALKDLTGDDFPEMIIAYKDTPEVIYHYSETKGMGMECATSYFHMTIYENGIVEYVSAGTYSSTTYLQFQEDVGEWVVQEIIACKETRDDSGKWINEAYYTGDWDGNGRLTDTISEAEYLQIKENYVTEPMQFEWFPLIEKN